MDQATLSVIGVLVGLVVMIILAFKGFSLLVVAPFCSVIVCLFSGVGIIPTLTGPYMQRFAGFAINNFLIFLLSAIFGRLIGDCGAAKYIAYKVSSLAKKYPGKEKILAVLCLIAIQSLLTYGGISLFVVNFTLVTIGKNLFEELDVPWGLYTCATLGSGCYTMTMLPGTPAIQNLIPMRYLGTTPMAAPIIGITGTIVAMILGVLYVVYEVRRNERKGVGFLPAGEEISKVVVSTEEVPQLSLFMCLLPSFVLLIVMNVLKQSPITALACACLCTYVFFFKHLRDIKASLAGGAANATNAIVNVCAVTGFGGVVAAVPGYQLVLGALDSIPGPPIVQLIVAVNVAAGFTGSASGGLGIALDSLAQRFLDMGLDPEIIHRLSAMSSGGLDSLPHNGAVINTLTISRLGHRYGYRSYFVMTVIIPIICTVIGALMAQAGIK